MPRHYDVLCLLEDIDNRWRDIGLALGLSYNHLDSLSNSQDTPSTKLSNVIRNWMDSQSSPVTWKTVISAIEGPIVNNKRKADEIRDYLGKLILIVKFIIIMSGNINDTLSVRYSCYFVMKYPYM